MAAPGSSLAEDAALFEKIFEEEFVDNAELEDILEDLSIYWNDDLAYALTYCCRTMQDLAKGKRWSLPDLYQSETGGDKPRQSDKAFVVGVVRMAYNHFQAFYD